MTLAMVLGAATPPGRLAQAIGWLDEAVKQRHPDAATSLLNLASRRIAICDGRPLEQYDEATREAVAAIARADAVLVAAPVYRASYPGVLKNLLDLTPVLALAGKPVGIVAMGGSPHHYLGVDTQLRHVLAWFGALAAPTSVYLTGNDFADGRLASQAAMDDLLHLASTLLALASFVAAHPPGPAPLAAKFS